MSRLSLPPCPFTSEEIEAGRQREYEAMRQKRESEALKRQREDEAANHANKLPRGGDQPEAANTILPPENKEPIMTTQAPPEPTVQIVGVSPGELQSVLDDACAQAMQAYTPEGQAKAEYAKNAAVYQDRYGLTEEQFVKSYVEDVAAGNDSFGAGILEAPATSDETYRVEYALQRDVFAQAHVSEADYIASRRAEAAVS